MESLENYKNEIYNNFVLYKTKYPSKILGIYKSPLNNNFLFKIQPKEDCVFTENIQLSRHFYLFLGLIDLSQNFENQWKTLKN
jgi:hypothetical protein